MDKKIKKQISIDNRKAYHDYFVEETLECGIELKGNEVKSIRNGSCQIRDSWCSVEFGELIIKNMFIKRNENTNIFDQLDETRERKLLAHKKEIIKLSDKVKLDGMTIIPLKVYESGNKIKILIGLCKGKHNYDKRQSLKEKQVKRDIERESKNPK